MKDFARNEWRRALQALATARQVLADDPDTTTSRAYYAAFHAVTALFALRNQEFSKHSALRTAVHRDLVKTGKWHVELAADYDYVMDLRETADYGGLSRVSLEDARQALESAGRILEAVREQCPELENRS